MKENKPTLNNVERSFQDGTILLSTHIYNGKFADSEN